MRPPPIPRGRRPLRLGLCGLMLLAPRLEAQRILGPGDDAVTLPRTSWRISAGGSLALQRDGWRDGERVGLGGRWNGDSLTAGQLPLLAGLDAQLVALGVQGARSTLGAPRLDIWQRVFVTPLGIEYGLTDRLTIGARATLVRTRAQGTLRIDGDSGRANVGVNPIALGSGVAAANAATVGAYRSAATSLAARRDACLANAVAVAECPTILADLARVNALADRSGAFASGLSAVYGTAAAGGQPYVPMVGSAAEIALRARADSLREAMRRYGIVTLDGVQPLPLGAQTPLTATDLSALITDPDRGLGARDLRRQSVVGLGDVQVTIKALLFDGIGAPGRLRASPRRRGIRQALELDLRVGTGTPERPEALIDLGTGTGMHAVALRSHTDIMVTPGVWATVSAGYRLGVGQTTRPLRLPTLPDQEFLEGWRTRDVVVRPGATIDLAVAPRWELNDYVAVVGAWEWTRQGADRHTLAPGEPIEDPAPGLGPLDPALLDERSAFTAHRLALGATFSTLTAPNRRDRGPAWDVSYLTLQTIASAVGVVPRRTEHRIALRLYPRFRRR